MQASEFTAVWFIPRLHDQAIVKQTSSKHWASSSSSIV